MMDNILHYDSQYGIIICRPCQYALVPREIKSHLQMHHQKEEGLTRHEIAALCRRFLVYPLQPPELVSKIQVSPTSPPIPLLRIYHDGFCCKLCPSAKPYVCRTRSGLGQHWKEQHQLSRHRGAPTTAERLTHDFDALAAFPVACQTFFKRSLFIRYFPVQPASSTIVQGIEAGSGSGAQALSLPEQIELQLYQKLADVQPASSAVLGQRHFSQVSPWLDTTKWIQYLQGHNLVQAAQLIYLPRPIADQALVESTEDGQGEHHLLLLLDLFDRVIEHARSSLLEDKVNVFDQHRVNSFIPRRDHAWPLLHKLREPTYRSYKKVWKQLLCFLYRLVWKKQTPILHCRLTSAQSTALHVVLEAAAELARKQGSANIEQPDSDQYRELDRNCLSLCIALLDHPLHGNIYDSIVIPSSQKGGVSRLATGDVPQNKSPSGCS